MNAASLEILFIFSAFGMIGLGFFAALLRLLLGPSLPDRIVALDLMAALTLAWCAGYTLLTGDPVFLDVAVVIALVTFLGTVALALFLEKRIDD